MVDWKKLKTEYIRGGMSLRKLAAKHGVSPGVVMKRASLEKWAELRKQKDIKTTAKIVETAADQAAKEDAELRKAMIGLIQGINRGVESGVYLVDASSARAIVAAVKDLRGMIGTRSVKDLEEQQARIDKLRKESEDKAEESKEIRVVISPELDEYAD